MQSAGVGAYFLDSLFSNIDSQTALVYAVLDCRRRPAWIRSRLS
jgi:hypothetical protein